MQSSGALAGRRVLFAGLREPSYVRNAVLVRALRDAGAEVEVISSAAGSYPVRALVTFARLVGRWPRLSTYDVLFAGFLGQPVAAAMRVLSARPILLDQFISIYDTLCLDRRTVAPHGALGRLLKALDRRACRAADIVLVDTQAQAGFLERLVGPLQAPIRVVPVGADERLFFPQRVAAIANTVFYYSSDLPLHGLGIVVEAAGLLAKDGIRFRIAGFRPPGESPPNVEWLGWLPVASLADEARRAELCLGGHFALNAKAQRVVPGKAFQFMALGRPVLLGAGDGNEAMFRVGTEAYFCRPGSAQDLAEAVRRAMRDPSREDVAQAGLAAYLRLASAKVQEALVAEAVLAAAASGRGRRR